MDQTRYAKVVGVVLAGGLSRRFGGGDKCLRTLGGETLVRRVVDRAGPQVGSLILNAAGDAERFADLSLSVVPDDVPGTLGPLAGILTGMVWAKRHVRGAAKLATFAGDAPFLPLNMVDRLQDAAKAEGADIAMAVSNQRAQPVFALWSLDLMEDLRHALVEEGLRKVLTWAERHQVVRVAFACDPVDPFFNINCEDDLAAAEALLVHTNQPDPRQGRLSNR